MVGPSARTCLAAVAAESRSRREYAGNGERRSFGAAALTAYLKTLWSQSIAVAWKNGSTLSSTATSDGRARWLDGGFVVNRELDTLRVIFRKAVEWKKLAEAPAIVKLRVDNVRRRVLTDDEQARLIAACPVKLRCLVMLLLLTGAPVGETLALRWQDVSDDGVLTFLRTKTGKIRCVGGTEEIRAVLAVLPKTHAHVFASPRTGKPYTADGLRSMLRRALDRASLDAHGVSFHTLRHSFATRLVAANVDIKTVSAILGHSTSRMLLERAMRTSLRRGSRSPWR